MIETMPAPTNSSRIPKALQDVFLASNAGKTVDIPPSDKTAFREFYDSQGWAHPQKRKAHQAGKLGADSPPSTAGDEIPYTLQGLLDALLAARGYSTKLHASLQTAYYNKPTVLQQASYHRHLMDIVRRKEYSKFRAIMACGVSLNPCNAHGESLVHLVARLGDIRCLKTLMELGCTLQVSDDYGRTPLHDACWAAVPNFDLIEMIIKQDKKLFFMKDARGALPLSYVHRDHLRAWVEFIDAKKDIFWPTKLGGEAGSDISGLVELGCNTRPIPDPFNALSPELAGMVAAGRITPSEAVFLRDDDDDRTCDETEVSYSEYEEDDFDSDNGSEVSDDDDYDSDSDFDEEEMSNILGTISGRFSGKLL